MTFSHPLHRHPGEQRGHPEKKQGTRYIFLATTEGTRYISPMTPQPQPARIKWAHNITARGYLANTHGATMTMLYAAYTYVIVPWSHTHQMRRTEDTETVPNAWGIGTARMTAIFCADEEEAFHPWQFCTVRWEAEKIRREIERRHPRPFRAITFETQEPHESGTLRNCRYLVYSLA